MYTDVRSSTLMRGFATKALPVTGAMMIGWSIVAAAVLIATGLALLSIARVLAARDFREAEPATVRATVRERPVATNENTF